MSSPLDRFKKRKAATAWLSADDANALDADTVATALGLSIQHQGRHYELSNGTRGTALDGRLVWCDGDGSGIGDNCALAQYVADVDFRAALALLLGDSAPMQAPQRTRQVVRTLTLPFSSPAARDAGRVYLQSRGIALAVLEAAEACGMLLYAPGAVLYVGREGEVPRSATRRGYRPHDPDPKRDLAGSNKSWPTILRGDVSTVWVVEGGTDALALHTIHPQRPTVIVSGGARVRHWIQQPHVQAILQRAWTVVIACENERTPEIQATTDAEHLEQARLITPACENARLWWPSEGIKDLADLALRGFTPNRLNELLRTA